MDLKSRLRVAIVGPCSAGKSTLAAALRELGYDVRQPAQEHSIVPNMWQILTKPDVLVYLDVDYSGARKRRPFIDGGPERIEMQIQRLGHARESCDFYIDTTPLSPAQVQEAVVTFLDRFMQPKTVG